MEKDQTKNIIIGILIGIIVTLIIVITLFATGTISINSQSNNKELKDESTLNEENKITESVALSITKEKIAVVFKYVHSIRPYCGEINTEDYILNGDINSRYESSKEFKTKNELESHLKTFLSENLITKYSNEQLYTRERYIEKNNKLYCLNTNKGCEFVYNEVNSQYTINNIEDNKIVVTGKVAYDTCGESTQFIDVSIELNKVNNNWIVTKYEEA